MTPKQVIEYYKGVRETADALGLTTACVYKWRAQNRIPYPSQRLIELHSQGSLKAKKENK